MSTIWTAHTSAYWNSLETTYYAAKRSTVSSAYRHSYFPTYLRTYRATFKSTILSTLIKTNDAADETTISTAK